MGTAKIDWDASWTDDTTMGSQITDTNSDDRKFVSVQLSDVAASAPISEASL